MSNYIGWAIHPKTKVVQTAEFLDNYFGPYKYGVRFVNDPIIYHEENIEIPQDWQVTESEEYKKAGSSDAAIKIKFGSLKLPNS